MKLLQFESTEPFIALFQRLIKLGDELKEIRLFDSNTNPAKDETDIYVFFPCDNTKDHGLDCGFYVLINTIRTSQRMFEVIEKFRDHHDITHKQAETIFGALVYQAFNPVVRLPTLTQDDVVYAQRAWLAEWVEELANKNGRMVDIQEYRRTFARYEEFHPDCEALDLFYLEQRELISNEIILGNEVIRKSDLDEFIKESLKRFIKDEDNGHG